jgi:STE24 endopeptidase
MQFLLILAVVAALVISEGCPNQPVSGAGYRLLITVAGMLLVALFALVASGVTARRIRRDFGRRFVALRQFTGLRRLHAVLWLSVVGGILFWLDWAQLVRFNWHLDRAFLLDDLLILTPVLLPMVLSWAAFYEVDHALQTGAGGRAAEAAGRGQYLGVHLRHYLGILMLPVLGLLALQDGAELAAPGILESRYGSLIYAPPIIALFVLFPVLIRHVWNTWPLIEGPLRERLESAADRVGFQVREILVWHTGCLVVNAAVAGFIRPLRYVFLTDGLLTQLTDEEIEVVFGHELGHVRHHHMALRVLAMIVPVSLWILLRRAFPDGGPMIEDLLQTGGAAMQLPAGMITLALVALYVLVVFGFYSRMLESQADLFGCRVLASDSPDLARRTFISALEKLGAAGGVDRKARSWQHASIARRVDFLNRLAADPSGELRFQRRVRAMNLLTTALVISPLVHALLSA